ncbi:MAG: C10 family peptidase [Sedimentisphaerales bacterium]|nr:C10 family peptidase [Sedimentisphaerales bacterium]
MNFRIRSRALLGASLVVCLFSSVGLRAEPVGVERVRAAADTFLSHLHRENRRGARGLSVTATNAAPAMAGLREIRNDEGTVVAFVAELQPRGFVVISADTDLPPILAYSVKAAFSIDPRNPLCSLLKEDVRRRTQAAAEGKLWAAEANRRLWGVVAGGGGDDPGSEIFRQWPAEGTTPTGGWVATTWDQSDPYNQLCPLDPVDGARSYVGCGATAMAQLAHYHQQCNMSFEESDSYTTYSGIDIDGDSERYDFPSFAELNEHLAAVRLKYSRGTELDDTDIAALNLACGVAAFMDYSSEGSGVSPYDMETALARKCGFFSADMTGGLSDEFTLVLQENIVNGLPALLGIATPDGMSGHVIICDGYNTDGEYHLNFGWGAPHPNEITEAWYRLPTGIPTGLSAIAEIILNIRPVPPGLATDPGTLLFNTLPGEVSEPQTLFVRNNTMGPTSIRSISSPDGFAISLGDDGYSDRIEAFEIARPGQERAVNVLFQPETAGGYGGTLAIEYSDDKTKYVVLKGTAVAGGTDVEAGTVSGTWTEAESPYYVFGDVNVPTDDELAIEPGVRIVFMGPYGLTVGQDARLSAEGTAGRPIEFTAISRETGWRGLRFLDSGDDDVLSYCGITFSRKGAGEIGSYGSYEPDADCYGGAIYCSYSSPTITHCRITNNIGDKGGAIYCMDSAPLISNTLIANNTSAGGSPQSGGICCGGDSALQIDSCTIVNNSPGGIFGTSYYWTEVTNTILWGNNKYQIETYESVATVSFCNVQGGYAGEGNVDADPCFFDPAAGVGADYDGMAANWALRSCSPCINSGSQMGMPEEDLAGNARIHSDLVDMGAFENQSDLPLLTLAPAGTVDTGFVPVDTNSLTSLVIENTGSANFEIQSVSASDERGVFSIADAPAGHVLAPGESVPVEIAFAPARERTYTGVLEVVSTASNASHRSIPLRGVGVRGTVVPGGNVSGTWKQAESPYTITGDVRVAKSRTLTIEPGVTVKFAGHFRFDVGYRATLRANGTAEKPIAFTPIDANEGWFGLRFVNTGDEDVLEHCTVEYAKKPYAGASDYEDLLGGGILCCISEEQDAGFPTPSSPTFDHCLIANNHAAYAGGIYCTDDSEAVITHCTIIANSTDTYGGGICLDFSNAIITNNVIAHNSAEIGGGLANYLGVPSIINNTIAHNRPSGLQLDEALWSLWGDFESVAVRNNIIWENEMFMSDYVMADEYDIRFNDVQAGWEGEGNIDVDPRFADSGNLDYHLKSEAGRWDPSTESWVLDDVTSPCIDTGDPESEWTEEPEPNGQHLNMGAYGGTAKASKTPETDTE